MTNTHTPGPWSVWFTGNPHAPKVRARGSVIAELIPQQSAPSNAALIALAPEMLAALEGIAYEPVGSTDLDPRIVARHILRKLATNMAKVG